MTSLKPRNRLDSALAWLDRNQLGEKKEYTEKPKELENSLKTFVAIWTGGVYRSRS